MFYYYNYYYEIIECSQWCGRHFIEWLRSVDPNQNAKIILKSFYGRIEDLMPDAQTDDQISNYLLLQNLFHIIAGFCTGNVNLVSTYISMF